MSSPEPATGDSPGLVALVREALAGSSRDFTEGPVGRAVLVLAVPMVLEMLMESVFAVVDVLVVARLGADAVATVGLTEGVLTLVYAVAMGLGIGAMAVVARRTGEGDPEHAARAAAQSIVLGLAVFAPIAVAGAALAGPVLALMGGSPAVVARGASYARVMFASTPAIVVLYLVNAVFRGAGDAAVAMRVLWLANAINIVLAPCLVFGWGPFPALGLTGAALATVVGRSAGVAYQVALLARGHARIRLRARHFVYEPGTVRSVLRVSGHATLQTLVSTASWIVLTRILAGFGSAAIAGFTIAMRLVMFALLPSWGLANAAATMVGQGLGAAKPERGERAVWLAAGYNLAFLGTVGLAFILGARPLVGVFTDDPAVAAHAVACLRLVCAGFPFYAYGMVMVEAFNGAGDPLTPTLINLGCFWALELPLAWALARPLGVGPAGAFASIAVAFSMLAVVSALAFRRGRWKTRRV